MAGIITLGSVGVNYPKSRILSDPIEGNTGSLIKILGYMVFGLNIKSLGEDFMRS